MSQRENYGAWFASVNVKFLEKAGARVVPITVDETDEYYENIFKNINGLYLAGGCGKFVCSKYAKTIRRFIKWSKEAAENGGYFPIWGACLGLEHVVVEECNLNPDLRFQKMPCDIKGAIDTVLISTEPVHGSLQFVRGPDFDNSLVQLALTTYITFLRFRMPHRVFKWSQLGCCKLENEILKKA